MHKSPILRPRIVAKKHQSALYEDALAKFSCLGETFLAFRRASTAVANKRPIARGKWSHGLLQRRGQQERRDATVYVITFPRPGVSTDRDASRESRLAWLIVAKQRRVQSAGLYNTFGAIRFVCSISFRVVENHGRVLVIPTPNPLIVVQFCLVWERILHAW